MSYRVVITDTVTELIREHARYIAVHERLPERAAKWLNKVFDAAEALAVRPRRYGYAAEHGSRPYEVRRVNVGGCQLRFTIADKQRIVYVIGFRHGHQLPRPGRLPEVQPEE